MASIMFIAPTRTTLLRHAVIATRHAPYVKDTRIVIVEVFIVRESSQKDELKLKRGVRKAPVNGADFRSAAVNQW